MNKRKEFLKRFPDKYFLDAADRDGLAAYLQQVALLSESDRITQTEVPGTGNMNYVIRVKTDRKSIILKQARPWVEKYPQIEAPVDRNEIEAKFYQIISRDKVLEEHSPKLLLVDPQNFIIALEDLGSTEDFSFLYQKNKYISEETCSSLANYLKRLHLQRPLSFPDNKQMRELNHEHIFKIPFQRDNGISLDDIQPGLSAVGELIYDDLTIRNTAHDLGHQYLAEGSTLLHGDFYPGSWMTADEKLYVLDPEFCFTGPAAFDIAVLIAHFRMSDQPQSREDLFMTQYAEGHDINHKLIKQFAAIEIIRRLLGIAQLPLLLSVDEKKALVTMAVKWLT